MGIGVDIVEIARFLKKDKLAKNVLSEREFVTFSNLDEKDKYIFLAGRFALKEAFLKANEKGILELSLKEIEVKVKENGAPYIYFKEKQYECSLSHDGGFCIGVVLL